MNALGERFSDDAATAATFLRCAAWVDTNELAAGASCFAREDREELAPPGIEDVLGEAAARKRANIEVFHADRVEAPDQLERFLVVEVSSHARDAVVLFAQL